MLGETTMAWRSHVEEEQRRRWVLFQKNVPKVGVEVSADALWIYAT